MSGISLHHLLRHISTSEFRYQHAKTIHAARVSLAILASILLAQGLNVPHGEWTSITVLIVIGGLQHHGNIRRKAIERSVGTLIGATLGLLLIVQNQTFGIPIATYSIISVACGVCAYYAVGKAGYIALLTAITIFIVGGHGDNSFIDGLWRTVNVVLGIAVALLFSFAVPLYATWTWRFKLAHVLRECAGLYSAMLGGTVIGDDNDFKTTTIESTRLVQLRALLPWVSQETNIEMKTMEEIQRSLWLCVSTLDFIAGMRRRFDNSNRNDGSSLPRENRHIVFMLNCMARSLKSGRVRQLHLNDVPPNTPLSEHVSSSDGYTLLIVQLRDEIYRLQQLLFATSSRWNI